MKKPTVKKPTTRDIPHQHSWFKTGQEITQGRLIKIYRCTVCHKTKRSSK